MIRAPSETTWLPATTQIPISVFYDSPVLEVMLGNEFGTESELHVEACSSVRH
jgi:hypothetical protein